MSESNVVRDSKAATVSLKDSKALAIFTQTQNGNTSVEMNAEKVWK